MTIPHFNIEILLGFFFSLKDVTFFFLFETKFHYIAQVGLKLVILSPVPASLHWDYGVCHHTQQEKTFFYIEWSLYCLDSLPGNSAKENALKR